MTLKKFIWMIPFLVLCSCASINTKQEKTNPEEDRQALEDALQEVPIEVLEYDGDLSPLTLVDEVEMESADSLIKFREGDADQCISVIDSSATEAIAPYTIVGEYNPTYSDVALVDENDNQVAIDMIKSANGQATYLIPVSDFEENHNYHLKLLNEKVKFLHRDASIRQITYYSLEVNDSNRTHLVSKSNEIKSFDINKVEYFDTDAYGAYFIYSEPFDIDGSIIDETGMKFRLANLKVNEDNEDTMYGKLVSVNRNPNGAGYLVRYEPCKGEDLYTSLDINDSIVIDENNCSNLVFYNDAETVEQNLGRAFLAHEDIVTAVQGIMKHYQVESGNYLTSVIDWATKLQIKFNTSFDTPTDTFTWGVTASLNLTPSDKVSITLHLDYKQTIRYSVSASLSIETWFCIPTGINYKLEVKEDDSKEVTFGVIISTNLAPYDEAKVKEAIENDLIDAFTKNTDVKSKFAGDGPTSTPTGKSYPLFRFDCYYFFPLDIRFEIDFYWKLQLTFESCIKWTSHTQRVDVSISNSKGCDPHSETKSVNDKSLTLQFMGTLHAEIGLQVSLGIGISGFYKFFHAEVYIAGYGAIDAQGFLVIGVAWGDGRDASITGMIGGKFEVSVGVKWGVDIELLFGGYAHTWPIARAVLVGFAHDSAINSFMVEESRLEITNEDYGEAIDLDNYHMLGVEIFDAKTFGSAYRDMKHDDGAKTQYGAWVTEKTAKYFTFELTKGAEYVTLNDYKLNIISIYGIENFDAEIKVTVNPDYDCSIDSTPLTKVIKIHFTNNLKQAISVINQGEQSSIGSYVVGTTVKLPVPTAPRYMRFVGWKNLRTNQIINYDAEDPNTGLYTPQDTGSVTFEYIFEDYYTWKVVWLDGLGNIIKTEQVFNGESANEPTAEERDQNMISIDTRYYFEFIGYDVDFTVISANTVIRALYEMKMR